MAFFSQWYTFVIRRSMTLMVHNKRSYYASWWFYNDICLMLRFICLILATERVKKNLKTLMLMKSSCLWDVTGFSEALSWRTGSSKWVVSWLGYLFAKLCSVFGNKVEHSLMITWSKLNSRSRNFRQRLLDMKYLFTKSCVCSLEW